MFGNVILWTLSTKFKSSVLKLDMWLTRGGFSEIYIADWNHWIGGCYNPGEKKKVVHRANHKYKYSNIG